jgi:hypothetical protein
MAPVSFTSISPTTGGFQSRRISVQYMVIKAFPEPLANVSDSDVSFLKSRSLVSGLLPHIVHDPERIHEGAMLEAESECS